MYTVSCNVIVCLCVSLPGLQGSHSPVLSFLYFLLLPSLPSFLLNKTVQKPSVRFREILLAELFWTKPHNHTKHLEVEGISELFIFVNEGIEA